MQTKVKILLGIIVYWLHVLMINLYKSGKIYKGIIQSSKVEKKMMTLWQKKGKRLKDKQPYTKHIIEK